MTTSRSTGSPNNGPASRAGANRVLARLAGLAALLVAAWLLCRPTVAEARRRIVVLELEGDKAPEFQDELEKFLKKSHSVVPRKKWFTAAEDLDATKVTDKNVKKVAKKLSVDGVIAGTVEKRGSRYYVRLTLRDGTTGKSVATTELVERSARFSAEGKETLTDELLAAIDELESAGDEGGDDEADAEDDDGGGFGRGTPRGKGRDAAQDDDDEDEDDGERLTAKERAARDKAAKAAATKAAKEKAAKDKAAKDKAAKAAKDKARRDKARRDDDDDDDAAEDEDDFEDDRGDRVADRGEDEDEDEDNPLGDDEEIEIEGEAEGEGDADPRTRPLDLAGGLSFTARRLSFSTDLTSNQPLGYKSNPVAGVYVGADLFPLAFNRKNRSITRNFGLTFVFDRVIKIESQIQQSGMVYKLGTTEQHFGAGVVYRHLIGKALTVNASVRYNKRKFVIDPSGAAMPEDVDIPNVDYTYVDPGLGVRYVLGPKMALGADGRFLLITDTGAMQEADQYGGAKVTGLDLGARVDYQLGAKLLLRAAVGMTRIGFTFKGTGDLSNNRDGDPSTRDVSGATDSYFGGALTGVYLF